MGGFTWGTAGWPNFNAMLQNIWGSGQEFGVVCGGFFGASNFVFGQNPPYYLDSFLAFNPKFFGAPTYLANCAYTQGANIVTVATVAGLSMGQFLQGPGLPQGTVITAVTGPTTFTVNNNATATQVSAQLAVYTLPVVPVGVIQAYVNLAWSSLVQARWQESWCIGMAFFIAHYCTLWAETDAQALATALQTVMHGEAPVGTAGQAQYALSMQPPGGALQSLTNNGSFLTPGVDYLLAGQFVTLINPQDSDSLYAVWPTQAYVTTPAQLNGAQVAAQAVATGVMVSKSVGDVSASFQALEAIASWGAWALTKYGQQLVTMAMAIGAGPSVIY
jgi:Protein of unknown function (DUF4054)